MGFLNRLFGNPSGRVPPASGGGVADKIDATVTAEPAARLDARDLRRTAAPDRRCTRATTLYVVGESFRQDALLAIVGGWRSGPVREDIVAELVPDPGNQYDRNAIRVEISGELIGYLSREDAAAYLPGLLALIARSPRRPGRARWGNRRRRATRRWHRSTRRIPQP